MVVNKQMGRKKQLAFTSDLSTNEYFLTRSTGCQPIGLVMGSSFYQIGFIQNFWGNRIKTGEVKNLSEAQLTSRELAVSRLQHEAALLGAHGVIGVRLTKRRKAWGLGMVEFTAIGTAIRIPGEPPPKLPFTSDLSGQEFWQLRQAGYQPKGMLFGVCSYYIRSDRHTRKLMNQSIWNRAFGRGRKNQELAQLTQGFQAARELAILRMTAKMQQLGATGTVGMEIEMSKEIEFYQPPSLLGFSFKTFAISLIPATLISFISGNSLWLIQALTSIFSQPLLYLAIALIQFGQWLSNLNDPAPYRDPLLHFIATGTAIVEADIPPTNPISNTLVFSPLAKS